MRLRRIEWAIIAATLMVAVAFFAPESKSTLSYFSPDSLESRYRTELLWGASIPVYRSGFKGKSSALVEYLIVSGFWSPSNSDKPIWLKTGHFNTDWKDGQTQLHRALYWNEEEWIAWSKEHPEIASLVWPRVLAALRADKSERRATEYLFWAKRLESASQFQRRAAEIDVEFESRKLRRN